MRKFKVLVIAHLLNQNKIAESGEIVLESQLTSPADELVSAGFLEEVFEDVKKEIKDIKKPFIKK